MFQQLLLQRMAAQSYHRDNICWTRTSISSGRVLQGRVHCIDSFCGHMLGRLLWPCALLGRLLRPCALLGRLLWPCALLGRLLWPCALLGRLLWPCALLYHKQHRLLNSHQGRLQASCSSQKMFLRRVAYTLSLCLIFIEEINKRLKS